MNGRRWFFVFLLVGGAGCTNDDARVVPPATAVEDPAEPAERRDRSEPGTPRAPVHERTQSLAGTVPLGECAGPPGTTLRVLVIGNSNIYYWDLPALLSELSRSAPPDCPRILAEGFTCGGQNLKRLWEGGDSQGRNLATTIAAGDHDFVVLSESIDLVELPPPHAQFVEYATRIIDQARAAGAVPVVYASPYVDQPDHYGFLEMAAPQQRLARERAARFAGAGLAWLRVWNELPGVFLHHTDHAHPGFKGTMVSAMLLYAVLTRASPMPLTVSPAVLCGGGPCPPISEHEGVVFRRAAWAEALSSGFDGSSVTK